MGSNVAKLLLKTCFELVQNEYNDISHVKIRISEMAQVIKFIKPIYNIAIGSDTNKIKLDSMWLGKIVFFQDNISIRFYIKDYRKYKKGERGICEIEVDYTGNIIKTMFSKIKN